MEKVMPIKGALGGSARIVDENTKLEFDAKKNILYRVTKKDNHEERKGLCVGQIEQEYDIDDSLIIFKTYFRFEGAYIPYVLNYLVKEDKFVVYDISEKLEDTFMSEVKTHDVEVNYGNETYLALENQFHYDLKKILKKNGKLIATISTNGYRDKNGNLLHLEKNSVEFHVELPSFKIINAYSTLKLERYDAHNMTDVINVIKRDMIDEKAALYGADGLESDISTVLLEKHLDKQEKTKEKTLTI